MAEERCFHLLNEIKDVANDIRFSDANPLQDLFDMIMAKDTNRLEVAKKQLHEATLRYEDARKQEKVIDDYLVELHKKLSEAEEKLKKLNSGDFVSKAKLESVDKLKEQIIHSKNILQMYRDATGVRICFNSPADVIAGYVAISGNTSSESRIEPFTFQKTDRNIPNEIWKKIEAVSTSAVAETSETA